MFHRYQLTQKLTKIHGLRVIVIHSFGFFSSIAFCRIAFSNGIFDRHFMFVNWNTRAVSVALQHGFHVRSVVGARACVCVHIGVGVNFAACGFGSVHCSMLVHSYWRRFDE